jgi:hypothetical protein
MLSEIYKVEPSFLETAQMSASWLDLAQSDEIARATSRLKPDDL